MDNTRCTEDSIPRLRPGIKTGSLVDRYNSKRKQWPSLENKCQGNIVHLQNQVCSNVDFNTLCNFKNNCGSAEANRVNFTSSDSHSNNYYHELFTSGFDLGNVTPNKYKTAQAHTTGHKSCRDRMKARAETRRDILINESSDEDYSSINSLCDLRLMSHKHSIIMDAANSKKSRAARTERYYRRLSREDSFRENDNFRAKNESQNKLHDTGIYAWKRQMHSFAFPNTNHIKECCSNLSFDQNHSFIDNPIYRSIRTDPPTSYNKHSTMEKNNDNLHVHQRESNGGPAYAINMNYNRFRRSDPGNDTILAYKKERSSHVPDPAKDTKLKANDYQASVQIAQLRKPSVNPTRHVKRSYSFQNEIPKKYDAANNVLLTMRRMPLTDEVREESSSSECISEDGISEEKYIQQSTEAAHVINDDMAYRKMQSNKMPALSETQNSLSQISYLLASSALILDNKTEYPDFIDKVTKEEPNITKDDMVYRNLHYTNNVLKVVEPQPPFGIPLRPATPSTNSNYLCSTPVALKSPPLTYVPQSEPNLITDDLAFRNLRKDAPKSPPSVIDNPNEVNIFLFKNDLDKSLSDDKFCKKKKKAVRSLSANLYGLIKDVHNLELNVK
ncbi:uncharacterized protein LOC105693699 isoform X3 [Athalia rosae]|uniref:uncharacterized protein LOC105693699 isoform X3 n=1 Tax=Athalia rosae TaxID=37344 RepID=UPI00203398FA|nr:uncharacterized protein LOC105693699 isoform X3 [Athalia rosae]